MKANKLEGLKSYFAFQAYGKIILGLKMLPMYMGEEYVDFFKKIEAMDPKDQENLIRQGVFLVDLTFDEIINMARFVDDSNGVPYADENMRKLSPDKIHEILVTVCMECARIKPKLLSEDEKKKS